MHKDKDPDNKPHESAHWDQELGRWLYPLPNMRDPQWSSEYEFRKRQAKKKIKQEEARDRASKKLAKNMIAKPWLQNPHTITNEEGDVVTPTEIRNPKPPTDRLTRSDSFIQGHQKTTNLDNPQSPPSGE